MPHVRRQPPRYSHSHLSPHDQHNGRGDMSAHGEQSFDVAALARRWKCSEGVIRKCIERKEIASFRLGTLIRVSAAEVARIECPTPSSDSEEDMPSSGTNAANDEGEGSTPKIGRAQKPRPAAYGQQATVLHGPWAD